MALEFSGHIWQNYVVWRASLYIVLLLDLGPWSHHTASSHSHMSLAADQKEADNLDQMGFILYPTSSASKCSLPLVSLFGITTSSPDHDITMVCQHLCGDSPGPTVAPL